MMSSFYFIYTCAIRNQRTFHVQFWFLFISANTLISNAYVTWVYYHVLGSCHILKSKKSTGLMCANVLVYYYHFVTLICTISAEVLIALTYLELHLMNWNTFNWQFMWYIMIDTPNFKTNQINFKLIFQQMYGTIVCSMYVLIMRYGTLILVYV